ncbi:MULTISPECIES: hypothetical protein [Paenibacillus]|jgi:hypothetical protein|uniref:Uncharacterized protein n=2 Tax=Paenibacillus TaxID=44249 RepID=A0ABX2ZE65_PAEPO|nr:MULTISPECIES: hypothetical protein [Paenibacillus]MBP1176234.1 hypothetical protein [Paenibacillus sp. PvR133]MDR6780879.1 hypothetical protein [Paenibacillus peoriae]ODA09316.1 hypothetical protein A7312_26535 [Paenibacillus polymyxa]POR24590.1 hypothetical protein CG775_25125 [Paenibacillus polymyxa]
MKQAPGHSNLQLLAGIKMKYIKEDSGRGKVQIGELENLLEDKNLIVLYHAMTRIGKEGFRTEKMIKK